MSKAPAIAEQTSVARLIDRAAKALAGAVTAAQVLDARDQVGRAYDEIKRQLRIHNAKRAHDDIIAAAHRAQADALDIEAAAKRRLADEYDGAQARGEVAGPGKPVNVPNGNVKATAADIGLSRKEIHEARALRDVMASRPGIVREALDQLMAEGDAPTRAALKRAIAPLAGANLRAAVGTASATAAERGNNLYETPPEAKLATYDTRSLGALLRPRLDADGRGWRTIGAGIGVTITDLSRICGGETVSVAKIFAVCDWLDVDPRRFYRPVKQKRFTGKAVKQRATS